MTSPPLLPNYPGERYEIDIYHAVMLVLEACRKVPGARVVVDVIQSNGRVIRSINAGVSHSHISFKSRYGFSSHYHDSFSIGVSHGKVLPLVGVRLDSARIDPRVGAIITLREQKWIV